MITTLIQKGQAIAPTLARSKPGLKPKEKIIKLSELQGSLKSKIKYSDKKADKAIAKMFAEEYGKVN